MLVDIELINKAKAKLGDRNAELIVEALGVEDYDEKKMRACCPHHSENTPSWIYNPKENKFHCFGCNRNTDIIDAFMESGLTYIESLQKLFDLAGIKYSFGEHGVKTQRDYRYPKEVVCTSKDKVEKYMAARLISRKTIDYADVREDEHGNIVFNYYDTNDVLTLVKYRPSRKISKGENKCWCQKDADTSPLLFNMNRVNVSEPLLICEGEMDALSAIESGYTNVVSVPLGAGNFHWIEKNWDWLEQFNDIIVCSDNDEAGQKMRKEVTSRLGSWRTRYVDIPYCYTLPDGKNVLVKDLNEVLYRYGKEKVLDIITKAKDSPVASVVDFSDINNINLDDIDGIYTGVEDLDRRLMKLFNGTLNIVTGVNGAGKSSFLSQLVCECMEQGKSAFMYSGELPNFQSKNWINYILAGQRHLTEQHNKSTVFWSVNRDAQKSINDYYREKLFIYRDDESHKVSDLMKSMEDVVRKYGAKLLIIDNLTSVNLENNDNNKYEKQAKFVTDLIDFAKKFSVVVVLVVHPHKIETMRRLTKMDVQGISAIIDLAHRILSLYRVQDADHQGIPNRRGDGWIKEPIKYDVICDILKDRMMGYEGQSIGMYYDRPSRRFFTNEATLDRQYSWDTNTYSTSLPYPPHQLMNDGTEEIFGAQIPNVG